MLMSRSGGQPRGAARRVQAGYPVLLLLLSGCSSVPSSINPVSWWHDLQGGKIAEERPPPPGADQPYPNLASVPPKPEQPDRAALANIATALVADRANAQHIAAASPLPDPSSPSASPGLFGRGTVPPPPPPPPPGTPTASATMQAAEAPPAPAVPAPPAPSASPASVPAPAKAPVAAVQSAPLAPPEPPAPSAAAQPAPAPPKSAPPTPTSAPPTAVATLAPPGTAAQPPAVPAAEPPAMPAAPPPPPNLPGISARSPSPPAAAASPPPAVAAVAPAPANANSAIIVTFANGSAELPSTAADTLKQLAARRGNGAIAVTGYGDATSNDPDAQSAALTLGMSRAKAMAATLTSAGVPANAVQMDAAAIGRGGTARLVQ